MPVTPGQDICCARLRCFRVLQGRRYHLSGEGLQPTRPSSSIISANLADQFPIVSIEDGMSGSRLGWLEDAHRPPRRQGEIVGDDIFVTNTKILKKASRRASATRS